MAKFIINKDIVSLKAKAGDIVDINPAFAELLSRNGYIEAVAETKVPKDKAETK